jgi:hypothetical protein
MPITNHKSTLRLPQGCLRVYVHPKINVNVKLPPTFLRCKLVTAIHCFAASFYIQFSFIHQYEASPETRGFT